MPRIDWDIADPWGPATPSDTMPTIGPNGEPFYLTRDGDPQSPTFGKYIGYSDKQQEGRDHAGRVSALVNGPLYSGGVPIDPHPFTFGATDRILIAGCGLGHLIQAFKDAGFPNTYGIDFSSEITSRRGIGEGPSGIVLVSEDIRSGNQARQALQAATGDSEFDWLISEAVMESYDGTELDQMLNAAPVALYKSLTPPQGSERWRCIHLVYTNTNLAPAFLVQDIDAWAAAAPEQSWVSVESMGRDYPNFEARIGSG
jgi:hypothetical protein